MFLLISETLYETKDIIRYLRSIITLIQTDIVDSRQIHIIETYPKHEISQII